MLNTFILRRGCGGRRGRKFTFPRASISFRYLTYCWTKPNNNRAIAEQVGLELAIKQAQSKRPPAIPLFPFDKDPQIHKCHIHGGIKPLGLEGGQRNPHTLFRSLLRGHIPSQFERGQGHRVWQWWGQVSRWLQGGVQARQGDLPVEQWRSIRRGVETWQEEW